MERSAGVHLCLRILSNKDIVKTGDQLSLQLNEQFQRTPAPGRGKNKASIGVRNNTLLPHP